MHWCTRRIGVSLLPFINYSRRVIWALWKSASLYNMQKAKSITSQFLWELNNILYSMWHTKGIQKVLFSFYHSHLNFLFMPSYWKTSEKIKGYQTSLFTWLSVSCPKGGLSKYKDISCSWSGQHHQYTSSKWIFRFNGIPIKIPTKYLWI